MGLPLKLSIGDVHDVGGNASYWCWSDAEAKDIDWYNYYYWLQIF